jgi:hypothetical protein
MALSGTAPLATTLATDRQCRLARASLHGETVMTIDAQQLQREAVSTVGRRGMFTSTLQAAFSQQARGAEATAAPIVTSNFRDGGCGVASRRGADIGAEVGNAWRALRLVGCALWHADGT